MSGGPAGGGMSGGGTGLMSGGGLSMGSGGRTSGIDGCSIMATILCNNVAHHGWPDEPLKKRRGAGLSGPRWGPCKDRPAKNAVSSLQRR